MSWTLPCAGRVTSPFGPRILAAGMFPFHYGVDVSAGRGPVFAAQAGVVRSIWITTKGGWVVDIRHADEGGRQIRTRYIHMYRAEIRVNVGQRVQAGDWIGNSGESGSPGSPHLHFEVMVNGALVNPVPFLAARALAFGVSLVSNVIGGVGVPPGAPAGTLPDPLTPEDDMQESDFKRINEIVYNLWKAQEMANILEAAATRAVTAAAGKAVWDHRLAKAAETPVAAKAWLVDTRIIVGQLTSTGGTSAISTADLARIAKAVADEQARRQVS